MDIHDLRRTVSTNLGEMQTPPHVIDCLLNHSTSALHKRYNRYQYLSEVREALEAWEARPCHRSSVGVASSRLGFSSTRRAACPNVGVSMSDLKLVTKKELRAVYGVPYSPQHIARLEAAGKFPKRIRLGQCRVAWLAGI